MEEVSRQSGKSGARCATAGWWDGGSRTSHKLPCVVRGKCGKISKNDHIQLYTALKMGYLGFHSLRHNSPSGRPKLRGFCNPPAPPLRAFADIGPFRVLFSVPEGRHHRTERGSIGFGKLEVPHEVIASFS